MTKYQPKQINILPTEQNGLTYTCTKKQQAAYNIIKPIKEIEHDLRKRNVDASATHGNMCQV